MIVKGTRALPTFLTAAVLWAGLSVSRTAADEPRAAFIAHVSNEPNIELSDIRSTLRPILNRRTLFTNPKPYSDVKRYFSRSTKALAREYPSGTFDPNFGAVFQSYSGNARFSFPEVHRFPIFPISTLIHDDTDLRVMKLKVKYAGKSVHGLRLTAPLAELYRRSKAARLMELTYLPTVNARALGFEFAQLIEKLSLNIEPAKHFNYNGLLPWFEHERYAREDQVKGPIALTNFAHLLGKGIYTVSVHPDFSLAYKNLAESYAKMTFFLWKREPAPESLPDFIFQVELE